MYELFSTWAQKKEKASVAGGFPGPRNTSHTVRSQNRHCLTVDYSKGRRKLNWEPTIKFAELVEMMVDADLKNGENLCKKGLMKS